MAIVYRFRTWDVATQSYQESARWATVEAIARVGGEITSDGGEVDDQVLGAEVPGMTANGFDPRHPSTTLGD